MSTAALTQFPSKFTAGSTVELSLSFADFPAGGGWSAKLYLAGASIVAPLSATADGDAFALALDADVTSRLAPGVYTWEVRASKGGKVYVAGSGTVEVLRNIAAAGAGDMQSWAERTLAVIEDRLAGRITDDVEQYQIHGRAVSRIPIAELRRIRADLLAEVRGQRGGRNPFREVRVKFTGTGGES